MPRCASGAYRLCPQTDLWGGGRRIGTVPAGEDPALFGGNAEFMFLPENAVLHRLPERLPEELAAWVLPYANAVDWVLRAGRLAAGENVVVLGPGYHGLAVTAAARLGEAGEVVVVGLPRDAERLGMAEALGATAVTAEESGDWGAAVRAALGGASCDLVVDTSGSGPDVVDVAVDLLGHGGRLVLTTPKQPAAVPADSAAMIRRCLTLTAVRGGPGGDRPCHRLAGRRHVGAGARAHRRHPPRRGGRHAHPARGRRRTVLTAHRRPARHPAPLTTDKERSTC